MGASGQATTPVLDSVNGAGPADAVRERLDDPRVAEALTTLLDHADLLAVLVSGLDGFVRRGDDITANLTSAWGELSGSSEQIPGLAALREVGAAYRDVIGRHFPAMALVQVAGLVEDRAKVEIEATAVVPD